MMHRTLDYLEQAFVDTNTLESASNIALGLVNELGFSALIYDYTPVAYSFEGEVMTPSYVRMLNVPDDMEHLWCHGGFYQRDPVQKLALNATMPFVWSYQRHKNSTVLAQHLNGRYKPVTSYLHDVDLICGVTVPIQRAKGDLATCTAIWRDARANFEQDARHNLSTVNLIAQIFHENAFPMFSEHERNSGTIHLTPRERECLCYCAEGLTSKEIAHRLNRSEPTITLHLQSAAKKLGARNRLHAVMLANHYRLLEL